MLRSIIRGVQLFPVPLPISPFPSGGKVEGKWRGDGRMISICTWLWEMKSWWDALPWHHGMSAGRHIFSPAHFKPLTQSGGKEIRQEMTNTPPWLTLFVCTVLAASIWTGSEEDYLNHFVAESTCHTLWATNDYLSLWWMTVNRNMATFTISGETSF